jgi:hypothetical protein
LFVVERDDALGLHRSSFDNEFLGSLRKCGLQAGSDYDMKVDVPENSPKEILSEAQNNFDISMIKSFQPDSVLQIQQTSYSFTRSGYAAGITDVSFDVTLYDVTAKKNVWKAQVKLKKDMLGLDSSGTSLAQEIVKSLKSENILRSCPAGETS